MSIDATKRLGKYSKRTHSVPATDCINRHACVINSETLQDAIFGPRRSYAVYAAGMTSTELRPRGNPRSISPDAAPQRASRSAGEPLAVDDGSGNLAAPELEGSKVEKTQSERISSPAPSIMEVIPFDGEQCTTWMTELSHVRDRVPTGIAEFFAKVMERSEREETTREPRARAANAHENLSRGSAFSSLASTGPHHGTAHGNTAGNSANGSIDRMAAIEDVWGDRRDLPISVASPIRTRGLFGGAAGRKELHLMVLAVLNKVTTDAEKFREVKNELLRLPIPEASPDQLDKIVDVFFKKAVKEQHFCQSYADLICALCKVPEGQHITGDKSLSLEFRMRHALLKRCQFEFVTAVKAEMERMKAGATDESVPKRTAEEEAQHEKDKRDKMCGNVRFVSELFLRGIVTEHVISCIFLTCAAGSEFATLAIPPTYVPTISQIDEIITTVDAVREFYFVKSESGRHLLPALIAVLRHWTQHYNDSRCRFRLMTTVEALLTMAAQVPNLMNSPLLSSADGGSNRASTPSPSPSLANHNTLASEMLGKQAMVGRKPLPAPRSRSSLATSLNSSVNLTSSATTIPRSQLHSPSLHPMAAPEVHGEAKSVLPRTAVTASKTGLPPEHIAKLMASLTSEVDSIDHCAEALVASGNVEASIALWVDRCLTVVKEEKTRKLTGVVLDVLLQKLQMEQPTNDQVQREDIQQLCLAGLVKAIKSKLYEDLNIFLFWAQLVLSDPTRRVLDDELLNMGLQRVLEMVRSAEDIQTYLVDVSRYRCKVLSTPLPEVADRPPTPEVATVMQSSRYRPVWYLFCFSQDHGSNAVLELLKDPELRENSMEADIFCTLGSSTTRERLSERLFHSIRNSPRVAQDSGAAAEVISAVITAEFHHGDLESFLESCIPLLHMTVDGPDRAERELRLLAEIYSLLGVKSDKLPLGVEDRFIQKLAANHVLSLESVSAARALNHHDEFPSSGGEHVAETLQLPLPPGPIDSLNGSVDLQCNPHSESSSSFNPGNYGPPYPQHQHPYGPHPQLMDAPAADGYNADINGGYTNGQLYYYYNNAMGMNPAADVGLQGRHRGGGDRRGAPVGAAGGNGAYGGSGNYSNNNSRNQRHGSHGGRGRFGGHSGNGGGGGGGGGVESSKKGPMGSTGFNGGGAGGSGGGGGGGRFPRGGGTRSGRGHPSH